jgi:arginase
MPTLRRFKQTDMHDIQIISAPSILGLKPNGVQELAKSLLASGLRENLNSGPPAMHVPTLNDLYSEVRDEETNCLNPQAIKEFSLTLWRVVFDTMNKNLFAFVLGGDCSILLGIMPALKKKGTYGLLFIDAHGDFYEPEKSTTGEVADMDLAIITGRGPDILANIDRLKPYVKDENVIHIGQRDWEETQEFGSRDIREANIKCFPLTDIERKGIHSVIAEVLQYLSQLQVDGFWIHFDTDALADEINPAVDYRLPGGLTFEQSEQLIKSFLLTGKIAGISVTIFNPGLDQDGHIARNIAESLGRAFDLTA